MPDSADKSVAVDAWLEAALLAPDAALEGALERNAAANLPAIDVSPLQGRLLELLVRIAGARRILEVGTLGGYSTICLARGAGPAGRVITLEYAPRHAEVARANLDASGIGGQVEIRPRLAVDLHQVDAGRRPVRATQDAEGLQRPGHAGIADRQVADQRAATVGLGGLERGRR